MKHNLKNTRRQRGFTLVEMSVTMAAAGLLFAAVTTGQELIDQAKATKLLNDVKTIEMQIQQYAQLKGRMPGDCDADGVIDYNAGLTSREDTGNATRAAAYAYSVAQPTIPAATSLASTAATAETAGCALNGFGTTTATVTPSTSNANVWLNDFKLAGVVSDSAPNRSLAKMVNEDFVFVGYVKDAGGESADGANYNAIVLHNVPQWMAIRLARAINGQDARADRSRVRLLSRTTTPTLGAYEEVWQTDADATGILATRDNMVSVVYFFDRVPESKMGA